MHPQAIALPPEAKLLDDPWSLTQAERRHLLAARAASQEVWMRVLPALVEPPAPAGGFPAFLLDTQPFARLRQAIGAARTRSELDTATADELQRFVDCYRGYLDS